MTKESQHPILPFLTELDFDQIASLDQKLVGGEAWEFYSHGQIKRATVFENNETMLISDVRDVSGGN